MVVIWNGVVCGRRRVTVWGWPTVDALLQLPTGTFSGVITVGDGGGLQFGS